MTAPGSMVEFFQEKKLLSGLCLKADKKSLHLLTEENRELSIPPTRVVLEVGGFMDAASPREEVVSRLRQQTQAREQIKAEVELEVLWELLCDEPGQYKVEELAQTFFGGTTSPEQSSGMIRALHDDRMYFERKNDLYIANSRDRVQQLLDSMRAEERRARERDEMTRWLQSAMLGNQRLPPAPGAEVPECLPKYVDWLKDVAAQGNEAPRFKEIHQLLVKAGLQQRDAAFQVLVKTRAWDPDENLLLHKHHVPRAFPAEVLAEAAEAVLATGWRNGTRTDLTHLAVVTIDDEHTVETDDGLSLERIEGGWRVGIHIADPSEFVLPGTALDREALHRATSIYLPDLKIPMLPPVLGTEACSLTLGVERPALSMLADLDEEGNLVGSQVVESVIRVREKLTYDQVDAWLEAGSRDDLATLLGLARKRSRIRLQAGALFIPFPSVELHVHTDEQGERHIDVRREEHDIPSHVLVSEFMILANEMVARFCVENGIPGIFRGQQPPSEPLEIGETFTALDGFRIRRLLRKGGTSIDAIRHTGLGLDAYLQFTSPIRRYVDLTMHRQVKSFLRTGSPLHTRKDIEGIMTHTGGPVEQADFLERQRKSYWILKHLEQNLWQEQDATVLQVFSDRYHVQLVQTLVETDCPALGGKVQPGDVIPVKIELVWPRDGVVRVSAVPRD